MGTLVLAVLQIGAADDVAPALATPPASRRVVVRPATGAATPVPDGVELMEDATLERRVVAELVRRERDDLVVVLHDDERVSPELAAALLAQAAAGPDGGFAAERRAHFLGREIGGDDVVVAWRGAPADGTPARLPGAVVTMHTSIADTIARLEAMAVRPSGRTAVGIRAFVWRPLAAVTRRLWRRRRDGVPGVILSILETFGEVLAVAHVWERHGVAARRAESRRGVPAGFHLWRTPWGWLTLRDGTPAGLREVLLEATPDAVTGEPVAGGRGAVWALALGGSERGVLRWYRRGGAVRWFFHDRYFGFTPRPGLELAVTEAARARGVAAPEVLAARFDRLRFGSYRGALVTREIAGAVTLADVLRRHAVGPERAEALAAVGRAMRHLHDVGVDHRDLNATNILLTREDAVTVWFIDFDRARLDAEVRPRARTRALARLARSLAKLARAGMPLGPDDLPALRAAYDAPPAAARGTRP